MTDTTPAAVAARVAHMRFCHNNMDADLLEALSAQLEASNHRAEMLADSVAKARAEGRADGLREVAKLAWDMDAKYLRTEYEINHNRKRYDISGVKRCEDKAANVISEDIHNAILALIPADTPAEPAQGMDEPRAITGGRDE